MTDQKRPPGMCKDCWDEYLRARFMWSVLREGLEPKLVKRLAPHSGPRCFTHDRAHKKAAKARAHERRVQATYGLGPGEYEALLAFQGGTCALCQRATGASKRLAVDHDHKTEAVRGIICGPCNQILGHGRDNPEFFQRIIDYLQRPPYLKFQCRNVIAEAFEIDPELLGGDNVG